MTPTLARATTAAFLGLFASLALLGLMLFAPVRTPVTMVPGGKIGLKAAALHLVSP